MKKKAYAVAVAIQVILASTVLLSKAAFDRGLSLFVYIFYRLVVASLFLMPFAILERCVRVLLFFFSRETVGEIPKVECFGMMQKHYLFRSNPFSCVGFAGEMRRQYLSGCLPRCSCTR